MPQPVPAVMVIEVLAILEKLAVAPAMGLLDDFGWDHISIVVGTPRSGFLMKSVEVALVPQDAVGPLSSVDRAYAT